MKKFKQLKINNLSKAEMKRRELNALRGGDVLCWCSCGCSCPCKYEGPQSDPSDSYYGGSSTEENKKANGGGSADDINFIYYI